MAWELKLEPKATFWHPQKTRIEAWGAFRGHWGGGRGGGGAGIARRAPGILISGT